MYKITVPTIITNGHFNKEKTLSELKRCGADRIALALDREVGEAFSSPENLKILKENIDYFRKNGLETLVWLGETFGHEGGPVSGESPYQNIKTFTDGKTKPFCPLDENFIKDFCSWVIKVAECGADMIMLDDDFRLGTRGASPGCCCKLHMQKIEEELGEKISEEELKQKAFTGGKNKYRDAWLKVQHDSMINFALALREALDTVSPDTRLSFCTVLGHWCYDSANPIELAKAFAGKTKPFLRVSGAPYWCRNISERTVGEVAELTRLQKYWCKNEDIEIMSEGDTYPRPRFATPAAYLEIYDMIQRADGTTDGILKYMLDYVSDADYETGYIDAHVNNAKNYKIISDIFSGKRSLGLRPYHRMNTALEAELGDEVNFAGFQSGMCSPAIRLACELALPTSYEEDSVNLLFGENARNISIRKLKNGSIIDITAAKLLIERGIDVGIESISTSASVNKKGFTDVPQGYFTEEEIYIRLDAGVDVADVELKKGAKVLSEIVYSDSRKTGIVEYENESGIKFLILPFDAKQAEFPMGWLNSYALKRLIIRWLERIDKPMPAYAEGNHPRLYTMVKENENKLVAGFWNIFPDEINNLKIVINRNFSDVSYINCKGRKTDNGVILDTTLAPYSFAAVIINN